ncbi:MAG TPA: 30S ribosomal protein S16 [Candidatus Azoamicus sp.]
MLSIRMKRIGKKNVPFYNIIVSEKLKSIKGKYLDKLGYFDPIKKNNVKINIEKINYWVSKGASITKRVKCIIKSLNKRTLV